MIPDSIKAATNELDPREARRDAFVAAARDVFFSQGYAGTAMSAIASQVGGSKTTLWSHFRSKHELFSAVVDDIVEQYGQALQVELDPAAPLKASLRHYAGALMATILSPPIVALHQMVTGEASRFPELGRLFYERGPRRGKAQLADFLGKAMACGKLRDGDPMRAAEQFSALCQAGVFQKTLFGVVTIAERDQIDNDIEVALDTFLRAWAVTSSVELAGTNR